MINSEILTIITCSICLSFIIGSIINSYVHEIYVYLEKNLVIFERKTHHPDEEPRTCGEAQVMIFGMCRIESAIFQKIQEIGEIECMIFNQIIPEHLKVQSYNNKEQNQHRC